MKPGDLVYNTFWGMYGLVLGYSNLRLKVKALIHGEIQIWYYVECVKIGE